MDHDSYSTASTREDIIRRTKTVVELVKLDIEREKSGDVEVGQNDTLVSVSSSSTIPTIPVNDGTSLLRNLFREEKETLKGACRCSCTNDDWSKIYLLLPSTMAASENQGGDLSTDLKSLVSDTHFDGFIILDLNTTTIEGDEDDNRNSSSAKTNDWLTIPPGLHSNIYVADSIINIRSCRVYRNSFISRTFAGANVVLMNCGRVSASDEIGTDSFERITISVGAESGGGRSLVLAAESTMIDVCRQLQLCDKNVIDPSTKPFKFNILSHGSIVCGTSIVQNVFLSPYSSIEAACSVEKSVLLDNAQISSGSIVSNVLMQWNASISGNSKINNVLLMEHSHLGPSSIVESTVIGPDSHASAGEIHASIMGPSANAHHQSLQIGLLNPLGRSNVGYGANVGSNHTGRLPDQECTAGEGIFWGLSCVIKYPIDLSMAPYTMVASGTRLAPQRITMPFSLIVESSSGGCDTTDIVPGWVLQHSPYTLARNDKKFATRRKATKHKFYTGWKIFRPSTIERCRLSRNILRNSLWRDDNTVPINASGIGECRLTERARECGIKAYSSCIQLYALRGLLFWLKDKLEKIVCDDTSVSICSVLRKEFLENDATTETPDDYSARLEWPSFPWDVNDDSSDHKEWEYQRKLLIEEFPGRNDERVYDGSWVQGLLKELLCLENDLAVRIAKCKRRDDTRGTAIIPGYDKSHIMSEADPVVMDAWEKQKNAEEIVKHVLEKLAPL